MTSIMWNLICPRKKYFPLTLGVLAFLLVMVLFTNFSPSEYRQIRRKGLKRSERKVLDQPNYDDQKPAVNHLQDGQMKITNKDETENKKDKMDQKNLQGRPDKELSVSQYQSLFNVLFHNQDYEKDLNKKNSTNWGLGPGRSQSVSKNRKRGLSNLQLLTKKNAERMAAFSQLDLKNVSKADSRNPAFQILNLARNRLKHLFKRVPHDIENFTPGEIVPQANMRRILIVSSWRSGSSFLGDILLSYPGTFYSFEPLHVYLMNEHLEDTANDPRTITLVRDLYKCNMTNQTDYVDHLREHSFLLYHNKPVWSLCALNRALCYTTQLLSLLCQYSPVNLIKSVRLGLGPVEELLQDPSLDLRVIYLVRDPRGVMNSRMNVDWCISNSCNDPATVCKYMLDDVEISEKLAKTYPDRFIRIRYEDLSLYPENVTNQVLEIAGLHYHENIKRFLDSHTKKPSPFYRDFMGAYSTARNSKSTAFAWRNDLPYYKMDSIQNVCEAPMQRLGYHFYKSYEEYNDRKIQPLVKS